MLVLSFYSWWYGAGWRLLAGGIRNTLRSIGLAFSAVSLLRTLFSPWRKIVSYPGAGLREHMRASVDNLVSRCVGFTVRIFVLLSAAVMMIVVAMIGSIGLVLWPCIPLLPVVFLLGGLLW